MSRYPPRGALGILGFRPGKQLLYLVELPLGLGLLLGITLLDDVLDAAGAVAMYGTWHQ